MIKETIAVVSRSRILDSRSEEKWVVFKEGCPLCDAYLVAACKGCPFKKFAKDGVAGCVVAIKAEFPYLVRIGRMELYPFPTEAEALKFVKWAKKLLRGLPVVARRGSQGAT